MRPAEIALSIETLYRARQPAFVQGSPGIGKNDTFHQVAAKLGIELLDLRLAQYDRLDLTGVPYVVDGRTRWALPDFWPTSGAGLLLLDEFNAAPREMQPPIYQLLRDFCLGDYKLPDGWCPFAAGNPVVRAYAM